MPKYSLSLVILLLIAINSVEAQDSIPDGLRKTYYESGELESEVNYRNGYMEGVKINYFKNGHVSERKTYVNDTLNGEIISYHKNGQIHVRARAVDEILIGEALFYYESGELQTYSFNNTLGEIKFGCKYDKDGVVTEQKGSPLIQLNVHAPNMTLSLKDTLKVDIYIARPPHFTYELEVGEIDDRGNWIDSLHFQRLPVDSTLVTCLQTFETKGSHYWGYFLTIKNLKTNEVIECSESREIHIE